MTTMASTHFLLSVLFVFLSCNTLSARTINQHKGFTVELFHHSSPRSPAYNPMSTTFERVKEAVDSSLSRFEYFSKTILPSNNGSIESEVAIGAGSYNMKLAIGTPPVELIAILDTGSDLIWAQCEPCEACYQQTMPIFDSRKSSTYKSLGCNSGFCLALDTKSCDDRRQCIYSYSYGDRSYTTGAIASETLTFQSSSGEKVRIPTIGFGCGRTNQGTFSSAAGGLIGLGGGPLSLISQLGSSVGNKFSYCFVSRDDSQSSSLLKFGDDAEFSGTEEVRHTPLLRVPAALQTFYYLNLLDISVKNNKLNIPTGSIKPGNGAGFIIDSGTTLTLLASDFYHVMESALRAAIVDLQEIEGPDPFRLCYSVDGSTDLTGKLPSLTFHFDGGADWPLPPKNTFIFVDNNKSVLCSAMVPSSHFSIFGNIAQQNVYVEYDLGKKVLSFAPTNCASS